MNAIRFSFFTVFSEGLNSVGKVSFKSTFSIKDRGQPSILVTSLSEKEPAIFKKTGTAKDFDVSSMFRHVLCLKQTTIDHVRVYPDLAGIHVLLHVLKKENESDDVTKTKFLKLWDFLKYSEST